MLDTLYENVKLDFAQRSDIAPMGELYSFNQDAYHNTLVEEVNFFIGPNPDVAFKDHDLRSVLERLRVSGVTGISSNPGWYPIRGNNGEEIPTFHFGVMQYREPLKSYRDLLHPVKYLEYLDQTDSAPKLSKYYSYRRITFKVYPTRDYAKQIYIYRSHLQKKIVTLILIWNF